MTVTLDLPPDLEAELSERAAQRGQAIQDYFLTLAEDDLYGLTEMSLEEQAEVAVVLRERIADRLAGDRGIPFEDYKASILAKRKARADQQSYESVARATSKNMQFA